MTEDTPANRQPDLDRITLDEVYEIAMLIKQTGKTRDQVIAAIEQHGPMRAAVLKALQG